MALILSTLLFIFVDKRWELSLENCQIGLNLQVELVRPYPVVLTLKLLHQLLANYQMSAS